MDSPLLNDNKINGCNVFITYSLWRRWNHRDEIGEINDFINQRLETILTIIGIGEDKNLKQGISVTIIATGFNSANNMISKHWSQKKIHTLKRIILHSRFNRHKDSLNNDVIYDPEER